MAKTIAENLTSIANSKEAIRLAIVAKGQACSTAVAFSKYAEKIKAIYCGAADFYQCVFVNATNKKWSGYKAVLKDGRYYFETTITEGLQFTSVTPEVGKIYTGDALAQIAYLYDITGSAGECPNGADCVTATCPLCDETYCTTHQTHTCDSGGESGGNSGGNNNDDDDDTGGNDDDTVDPPKDDGNGGEEVSEDDNIEVEIEGMGNIKITRFHRNISFNASTGYYEENGNKYGENGSQTDGGQYSGYDWYLKRVQYKDGGGFDRNYGYIGMAYHGLKPGGAYYAQGELYSEEGNLIFFDGLFDPEVVDPDVSYNALGKLNKDFRDFYLGELVDSPVGGVPNNYNLPTSGWIGYDNYRRYSYGTDTLSINDSFELKSEMKLTGKEYSPPYVSQGESSGAVKVDTFVAEWNPDSDYTGTAPVGFVLTNEAGKQHRYLFDTEYCPQALSAFDLTALEFVQCHAYGGTLALKSLISDLPAEEYPNTYVEVEVKHTYKLDGLIFKEGDE